MKKLPIGIQNFREIIEDNYIYIDKTEEAYQLVSNYKYVFLSRPRRFGKSLFVDTLKELFEGNKKLFEGLYIYDKWNWDEKYPVIKISWAGDLQTLESVKLVALDIFKLNQEILGIICDNTTDPGSCFRDLIRKTYKKYGKKVVILIDEYDKPILDVIENVEQAKVNRGFLRSLYSIIKDNDAYIRFAFLTGVSKFSKASIFSGLNMLTDISLNPKFGNICGYTQRDIETSFKDYFVDVDMEKVKRWYNGYNFLKDNVYNPFDILQFISNGFLFRNYWFETGTPSFLIKLIKERNYFLPKLTNLIVDDKILSSFDIENIDLEVILFQSGYLTIEKVIQTPRSIGYKLRIPNLEVQISLNDYILRYLFNHREANYIQNQSYDAFYNGDLDVIRDNLTTLFSSIPYTNYTNNELKLYEGFYASVVYSYLASLGFDLIGEDVTNKGRIDLTVFASDKVYIIEFKVDGVKSEALKQIKEKRYYEKYFNDNKEIYLVGIEFSSSEKNIVNFEWEKLER
ncbi:ATP-binding protein [Calditerrivibrio nitroreducens]|uniref:AAA-ATPase n=1 Tax=Calditerrivibrio nitroreducens (strain DSM 19672 / NBRC 101217 / Yu37-1) TaxID=768670 RepID=E4TH29_CALNY|nr:ATP-binding protein [Calditerrivibrio nitroreducens]ADR19827.1 AAA-ATPase [Calditerrivibrio nitroreducens DSM 19672]